MLNSRGVLPWLKQNGLQGSRYGIVRQHETLGTIYPHLFHPRLLPLIITVIVAMTVIRSISAPAIVSPSFLMSALVTMVMMFFAMFVFFFLFLFLCSVPGPGTRSFFLFPLLSLSTHRYIIQLSTNWRWPPPVPSAKSSSSSFLVPSLWDNREKLSLVPTWWAIRSKMINSLNRNFSSSSSTMTRMATG